MVLFSVCPVSEVFPPTSIMASVPSTASSRERLSPISGALVGTEKGSKTRHTLKNEGIELKSVELTIIKPWLFGYL